MFKKGQVVRLKRYIVWWELHYGSIGIITGIFPYSYKVSFYTFGFGKREFKPIELLLDSYALDEVVDNG